MNLFVLDCDKKGGFSHTLNKNNFTIEYLCYIWHLSYRYLLTFQFINIGTV